MNVAGHSDHNGDYPDARWHAQRPERNSREAFLDRARRDLSVTSGTGIPLAVRKRLERGGQWEYVRKSRGAASCAGALGRALRGGGPPSALCGVQRWYAGTISRILRGAHLRPNPAS